MSTRNTHPLYKGNDAAFCREMGWGPGTRIVGDEGYGPTIIEIIGVGVSGVFARCISHNGGTKNCGREGMWTLSCRNWSVVSEARP